MLRLLAGVLALALTAPVWADQPSFSFAGAAYQRVELDGIGLNFDGNSFGIDVNELQVGAGYDVLIFDKTSFFTNVDLGNGVDGRAVGGAGWYRLRDSFAIGLIVNFDEDVVAYGIGGRYYFGD